VARRVQFADLESSDLFLDAIYQGGKQKNLGAEVLHKLLPVGNAGGFRYSGSPSKNDTKLVALYTSGEDPQWPDHLDTETGIFTYYGDNKTPGNELHETKKGGNRFLRFCYDSLHRGDRESVPPFFLFEKHSGRDMKFRGLAVPGSQTLEQTEDLVAIWKTKQGERFQNYRAKLTVLDVPRVKREWIDDLSNGDTLSENCPEQFKKWIVKGQYSPLSSEREEEPRQISSQLPSVDDREGWRIINAIHSHFPKKRATDFEYCAARLFEMVAPENIVDIDVTRPSVDGGRDAMGKFRIGIDPTFVTSEFALEAKCWDPKKSCGVGATKRLISRLRHRQFGVFITTSSVSRQAYQEIIDDGHPILIISARDIVTILRRNDMASEVRVMEWLNSNWPTK
jgi:hypothetical protein